MYRKVLYSTYVSANKRYLYQRANARTMAKKIRSVMWSLGDWLPTEKTARILDLGCGAGHFLAVLQDVGYADFIGVDDSAEQVELTRRRFPSAVIQADVFEYLKREDIGQFDLITAFDVLEHFTKDEAILLLRLIHRRLKPSGAVIVQTPNGDSPFAGSVIWSDLTHETFFTVVSLRHLLEACGFTNCEFRERGPVPLSLFGLIRTILWQIVRLGLKLINCIETGTPSTGIYTRVFACRAIKK